MHAPVLRFLAVAVLGVALAGVLAGGLVRPVGAQSVGPRISPARVDVESPIPPGSRADLPALVVRNEGDTPLDVLMGTSADDPAVGGWVSFDPSEFSMTPGESRVVHVRVTVPRDAVEGPQRLRLRATTTTPVSSSGVAMGFAVAVATVVDFTVGWPADGVAVAPDAGLLGVGALGTRSLALALVGALVSGVVGFRIMAWVSELEFRSPVVRRPRSGEASVDDEGDDTAGDEVDVTPPLEANDGDSHAATDAADAPPGDKVEETTSIEAVGGDGHAAGDVTEATPSDEADDEADPRT